MLNQDEQIITRKAFARLNHAIDAIVEETAAKKMVNPFGKPYKHVHVRNVLTGKADDLPLEVLIMQICKDEIEKKGLLQKQKEEIAIELKDVPLVVNNHRTAGRSLNS